MRYGPALVLLGVTAGWLLNGCAPGGSRGGLEQPPAITGAAGRAPALPLGLPAPAGLPQGAPRRGSYVEAGLRREGAQYAVALPADRVTPAATLALFAPVYSAGDSGLGGAAYAIYRFEASGYDREPQLRLSWDNPPAAGTLYLALANFAANRWDWFQPAAAAQLDLTQLAANIAPDGALYAAVLLLGDQAATLASLRLGEPRPLAVLSADPLAGVAPLEVSFDASASTAPDSTLTLYEWDFDGDGSFETDTADNPLAQHVYADGGEFAAAVRVTNSFGFTASAGAAVSVTDEWLHTAGEADFDYAYAIAQDAEGNLYTAGTSPDSRERLLLCKWNKAGELVWGRIWRDGVDDAVAWDVAVDAAGSPVVCGSLFYDHPVDYEFNAVLLKWTSDGELSWARRFNGAQDDKFKRLCIDGTDIYVAGDSDSLGADSDILLLRFGADGNLLWARRYDWFIEQLAGLRLLYTPSGATALYALASEYNTLPNPDDHFPLWMRYSLDGDFEADGCFINSDRVEATGLALEYEPLTAQTTLYITGHEWSAYNTLVLMATTPERADLYCQRWEAAAGMTQGMSIELDSALGLLVAGHNDYDAALMRFAPVDGSLLGAQRFVNGEFDSEFYDLLPSAGRLYACGYSENAQGSWEDLSLTPTSLPQTWLLGGGLFYNESLSMTDPLTDSAEVWEAPVLDTGGGLSETLIAWRAAP